MISTSDSIVREAVFYAYKGKSFYSGKTVQFDEMHVDHVIPLSRGGKNELCNIALAHPQDNLLKSDLLDEEAVVGVLYQIKIVFLPRMQRYLLERGNKRTNIELPAYHDRNQLLKACPGQVVCISQITMYLNRNRGVSKIIERDGSAPITIVSRK